MQQQKNGGPSTYVEATGGDAALASRCMNTFLFLAFAAGAAIAAQASMNAHLGLLLGNPAHATVVAFSVGLLVLVAGLSVAGQPLDLDAARAVPAYLWVSGGLLSSGAIVAFYWLIPRMGIGPMMSAALAGQLLLAMALSHVGAFGQPVVPFTLKRLLGAGTLLLGVLLVQRG